MLGSSRRTDELCAHEDGRIRENLRFDKVNKLAGVIVNERGQSHLLNNSARNRSSSLYNGGTMHAGGQANTLQFPTEPELANASTLNQRRATSCSINLVNDNHKHRNYLNDQTFVKQSNLLNEHDNQQAFSRDELVGADDAQADATSGLFGSVWSYLSNIPKKRSSPSKARSTIYSKLCNSLNSSPVHRLVRRPDTKELYETKNETKNESVWNEKVNKELLENNNNHVEQKDNERPLDPSRKQCTCKCTCGGQAPTVQSSSAYIASIHPSDITAKIHEMEKFEFQPYPTNKQLSKIDTEDWLRIGKEMVDYIAYYLETLDKRRVTPDVEPGYLKHLLPKEAPKKAQEWRTIMMDFERCILPGITHWQASDLSKCAAD